MSLNRVVALVAVLASVPGASAATCTGQFEGTYTAPATVGATGAQWDPHPLPLSAAAVSALQGLNLRVEWSNTAGSSADFGIAAGGDTFRYWNHEYQASLGDHQEQVRLERAEIEAAGWHRLDRLRAGPSVSTGQIGVEDLPYAVTWDASVQEDETAQELLVDGAQGARCSEDPATGSRPLDQDGDPIEWDLEPLRWQGLVLLALVGAGLAVFLLAQGRERP